MKQYSFNKVDLILDGVIIDGFTDGAGIITAARSAAQHGKVMDARGKMAVTTSADQSGYFAFNLLQTSDSNQVLLARSILDQSVGLASNTTQFIPITGAILDKMGGTLVAGTSGFIPKRPNVVRGSGITTNSWMVAFETVNWGTSSYTDIT
jgi:hypothetical protein